MFEFVWFLWVNQRGVEIIDNLLHGVVWKIDVLKKKLKSASDGFQMYIWHMSLNADFVKFLLFMFV